MIIGISGMVSSGKSTLTKNLVKHFGSNCLYLNEYEEDDEIFLTFLKWMFEKKENIGLGFECYILENYLAKLKEVKKSFKDLNLDHEKHNIFLDRFAIEHYIFAVATFLDEKFKKILWAYKLVFEELIKKKHLPDFAIYLDINFETFKKRIFKRGREIEINNFDKSKNFFEALYNMYKDVFTEMANKYKIPFQIIKTDDLTAEEVCEKALKIIENFKSTKEIEHAKRLQSKRSFI